MSEQNIRNMLSAPAVRYFCEVAQSGSFRQAAERVHVAASAIHRQVALLEQQVGAPLLERRRGRGGVRLTAAGEILLHRVTRAMDEVSRGVAEIETLRTLRGGRVALGTADALARDMVPPLLATVRRAHPRLTFEVRIGAATELVDRLLDDRLDLVVCYDVPRRIGVRFVAEFALPTCAVVPEGHPLAERAATTLAECAQYPLLLPEDPQYLGGLLHQMLSSGVAAPEPLLRTNSFVLMRDAVVAGLGISIQTRLRRHYAVRQAGLVYVPLRETLANFSVLSCCVRAGRRLTPAASWMLDRLIETLKDELQPEG